MKHFKHLLGAALVAAALAAVAGLLSNDYYLRIMFMMCVYYLCAVGMNVFMAVSLPGVAAFELHFIGAAAACGAHSGLLVRLGAARACAAGRSPGCGFHVTSSSLTRISVPPVTCT